MKLEKKRKKGHEKQNLKKKSKGKIKKKRTEI